MYGYDNAFSLKWGMSSWDEEFATNSWVKNAKDQFTDQLEVTENSKPEKGVSPSLSTGKSEAKEILKTRIKEAFTKPYKEAVVKSALTVENPQDYFIVNYTSNDVYKAGHIKGAIQYEPNKCLNSETSLLKTSVSSNTIQSWSCFVSVCWSSFERVFFSISN